MRQARIERKTGETDIALTLNLDGSGKGEVRTGIGFLDHMLSLLAFHGRFDLSVRCEGDTWVDGHHTTEDVGIALGQAFLEALGDKKGIARYGNFLLPMDEALVLCAVDLCGRDTLGYQVAVPTEKVGEFDTQLVQEFMLSFARNLKAAVHFVQMAGSNSHHIIEAMFKGLGRALGQAAAVDAGRENETPSSKGVL